MENTDKGAPAPALPSQATHGAAEREINDGRVEVVDRLASRMHDEISRKARLVMDKGPEALALERAQLVQARVDNTMKCMRSWVEIPEASQPAIRQLLAAEFNLAVPRYE